MHLGMVGLRAAVSVSVTRVGVVGLVLLATAVGCGPSRQRVSGTGGTASTGGKGGGGNAGTGAVDGGSGGKGSGGAGGTRGGDAGEAGEPGRGGSSGAGASSGSGGSSEGGSAGDDGPGGAGGDPGTGGVVGDFKDSYWAAFCHGLFACTIEGDGADTLAAATGSEARCREIFQQSPASTFGLADLAAAVEAGRVTFAAERVSACLDAVQSCTYWWSSVTADAACRRVYEGSVAEGEACYRDEECADGGRCVVTDACPGSCAPRAALDEECSRVEDCDASGGLVACREQRCQAVEVAAPAGEGDPCRVYVSSELDLQPCADGLWCDGDGVFSPPGGGTAEERFGICRAPIAAGDPCDDGRDVCESGFFCRDEVSCKPFSVVRAVGGTCDETHFCDPFARLGCENGQCESTGDGTEGSSCEFLDWSAHRACEPGLACAITAGEADPVTSATMGNCVVPRAAGESCKQHGECASQTCGADGFCADRYCGTAHLQF